MAPAEIKAIRTSHGLTQSRLASVLRMSDRRTIRRWESGEMPVSGPASILLEMIEADELPHRYYDQEKVK